MYLVAPTGCSMVHGEDEESLLAIVEFSPQCFGGDLSGVAEAGAIAFKSVSGSPLILLVRAKKNPQEWIFPKGHIESGETAEAAAARELQEEAGISGELLGHVGALEFQSGYEMIRVEYYLFRFVAEVARTEERESRWCKPDEALALLSFSDSAELLKRAFPMIDSHTPRS